MGNNGVRSQPVGHSWNPCLADPDLAAKIALDEIDAGDGIDRQQIQAHHPAGRADQTHGDLGPTSGGGAQVHDPHSRLDQTIFILDLQQLVSRP